MARGVNLGTVVGIGLLGFGGYYLLRRRPETGTSLLGELVGADIGIGPAGSAPSSTDGSTALPAGAPAQPAPAATPQFKTYTTQGESLEDVSNRFYQDRRFAPILYRLNEDTIGKNPDIRGRAGLTLRIPTREYLQQILRYIFRLPPSSGGSITPPSTGSGGYLGANVVVYTVRAGDTLSSIAARYRTPGGWAAIYERNRATIGVNPNLIYPGQVLEVPVG